MKTRLTDVIGALASVVSTHAVPIVYQATGYSPADIAGVVEQFRRDISEGGVNNGDQPRPFLSGWREITWDVLPNREIGHLDFVSSGVSFIPIVRPIGASTTPAEPSDPNRYFGDINPTYSTSFQPFSAPSLMAEISPGRVSSDILFAFRPPGGPHVPLGTSVRALGIVFSDVDLPNTTSIRVEVSLNESSTYFVSASPGNGGLSFWGIRMDPGVGILSATILAGNKPLSATAVDGAPHDFLPGTVIDVVAIDNVIFSEPRLIPEPASLALILTSLVILLFVQALGLNRRRG